MSDRINLEEIRKRMEKTNYYEHRSTVRDDISSLLSCVEQMREALKSCKMGYHGMEECMEFNWDKVQEAKALFSDTEEQK